MSSLKRHVQAPELSHRPDCLYAHVRFVLGGWPGEPGGAVNGNRTRVASLEGWCSAVELPPHTADQTAERMMMKNPKMLAAMPAPIRIMFSAFSMLPLGA